MDIKTQIEWIEAQETFTIYVSKRSEMGTQGGWGFPETCVYTLDTDDIYECGNENASRLALYLESMFDFDNAGMPECYQSRLVEHSAGVRIMCYQKLYIHS